MEHHDSNLCGIEVLLSCYWFFLGISFVEFLVCVLANICMMQSVKIGNINSSSTKYSLEIVSHSRIWTSSSTYVVCAHQIKLPLHIFIFPFLHIRWNIFTPFWSNQSFLHQHGMHTRNIFQGAHHNKSKA